jgi:glycosyltransferase involved in cell wall biosynthesis
MSMSSPRSTKLFVEATPLLDEHLSGIGHLVMSMLQELTKPGVLDGRQVVLVAPIDKMSFLKSRTKGMLVSYKSIPLPARILYLLMKRNLVPPLDLVLGRGVYLFPNYRNWRLAGSRSITYIHDMSFRVYPQYVSPRNLAFLERNMPAWLKQTDVVAVLSEQTKKDLVHYYEYPATNIDVVPCGIDPQLFNSRSVKDSQKTAEKYDVTMPYLMFLSTVEPRKNLLNLLRAYEQLPARIRDKYALLIIGANGWLNSDTLTVIRKLQKDGLHIFWPQTFVPDEDLPLLLSGATMLLFPSYYEGFGIPALEAMACRTSVIVARNSSFPEVVGDAGLYVEPDDPKDIGDKITHLIDNSKERERYARAGYERSKQFSWAAAAHVLAKIIAKEGTTK